MRSLRKIGTMHLHLNGINCWTLFTNRQHYHSLKLTTRHICSRFITTRPSVACFCAIFFCFDEL